MRGYCAKCQEYRSDDGFDAWDIIWDSGLSVCEKCGSFVNTWENNVPDMEDIETDSF